IVDSFDTSALDTEITSKLIEANKLCCKADGVEVEVATEIKQSEVAGFQGKKVSGFERALRTEGKVSGTAFILNTKLLNSTILEKTTNASTKFDGYAFKEGIIKDTAYNDVVVVGTTAEEGKDHLIVLRNCLNESGFKLSTEEEGDAGSEFEMVTRYSVANLKQVPVEVFVPKEA
ncbi:MAG: hypothetical protein ACRDD7_01320, partial [Peptostreptococcaceae bacterium]